MELTVNYRELETKRDISHVFNTMGPEDLFLNVVKKLDMKSNRPYLTFQVGKEFVIPHAFCMPFDILHPIEEFYPLLTQSGRIKFERLRSFIAWK